MRNFATEGTPLALSNSGSHTNLSTLTMDKDDDGSSDSDGDLLAAVAQRGERPLGGGGGGARHPVNLPSSRNGRSRSSLGVREEGEGRVGVRAAAAPKVTSGPTATAAAARAAAQRRGGASHLVQHGALTRPR